LFSSHSSNCIMVLYFFDKIHEFTDLRVSHNIIRFEKWIKLGAVSLYLETIMRFFKIVVYILSFSFFSSVLNWGWANITWQNSLLKDPIIINFLTDFHGVYTFLVAGSMVLVACTKEWKPNSCRLSWQQHWCLQHMRR
jgi:hypothetical protein